LGGGTKTPFDDCRVWRAAIFHHPPILQCVLLTKLVTTDGFLTTYVIVMIAGVVASTSILAKIIVELSICQYSMERSILSSQTGMTSKNAKLAFGETIQRSQLLRYKQDIVLRPLGLSIIGGTVVITSQTLAQTMSFLITLFFVLLNIRSNAHQAPE